MPTRTFESSKSSLFASTSSSKLGGGKDTHLPLGGPWNGYTFRGAIAFSLDFSGMTRITSAVLKLRTSSAVHVGFSSAPDFYVARATEGWSANGSSSSADGGSGWSTSPDVYPGPATTTTGRVSKRAPTAESTWFDTDVTAIVRAWAPTSVEGGGNVGKYGLVLYGVASGDVTEVQSHESTYNPSIVVTYETDAPPVATPTGPTGTVTTLRPTITGTGSDPDGDAITSYGVEVRQGATVVHSATTGSGATLAYVPTADLPSGALTVRLRATAAGVTGAWSADLAFVVDRPAAVASWSAPAATVTGTRRPTHAFSWSDPDGDPGELFDIAVYVDAGGGVAGAYVTGQTNVTVSGGTSPCSWAPSVDLPGGPLVARSRVRTRGVWSAWSAYHRYTVVLTVPTLTWDWPEYDGGWARRHAGNFNDPTENLVDKQVQVAQIKYAPPAGTTIASTTKVRVEVEDVGIGGPAVGTVLRDASIGAVAGGGTYLYFFQPSAFAPAWLSGTLKITFTIIAANGGQTVETRRARFAGGEWFGAVALGDQVTGLTANPVWIADRVVLAYRAQSSPTAAVAGQVWTNTLATAAAALPATNAYLGVRSRISRQADDTQVVRNPSFEDGLAPWAPNFSDTGGIVTVIADATAPDGGKVLRVVGNGVQQYPSVLQTILVADLVPGATYKFSCSALKAGSGGSFVTVYIRQRNAAGSGVGDVTVLATQATSWQYGEVWYTVPTDGSIVQLQPYCLLTLTPSAAESGRFDRVKIEGPIPGDAGLDRLELAWTSLG